MEVEGLPEELRRELTIAALRGAVVGMKVGGKHVSFCHAEVQSETMWDVSIDTLEEYRRRGHAEKAVAHLADHMFRNRNKRPMWGALETNEASLLLAAKLGFRAADEIVVFERG
jgi:ribosomal protein S18 acetylase RimI-like enzyme